MYIDDTISTVKSLVGFTDVTDICRPVMYTEFNTLIVEIKNLSMEVNFMDSSDGLGRSKNNIGADIQVSIVLAGIPLGAFFVRKFIECTGFVLSIME